MDGWNCNSYEGVNIQLLYKTSKSKWMEELHQNGHKYSGMSRTMTKRPDSFLVIDWNNILHVLIDILRTAWPAEIVMPSWVSQTICFRMPVLFKKKKKLIIFWDSTQNMLNFGLGCPSPLTLFEIYTPSVVHDLGEIYHRGRRGFV